MPIPPGSVRVGATSASLDLSHRKIDDYGNVVNALTNGTEIAHATIDVEVNWSGGTQATASGSDFSGSYLRGGVATLSWSAKEPGFTFHSGTGSADFAQFGTEKSGVFNT
jgi:histone acetyltransferase (RNA polymerase elongator complex component)